MSAQEIRRSLSIHMKRLPVIAVSLALASALAAHAQTPAASSTATARIAVIQFQLAVSQTNEFQRDYADLQKKYDPKREALKALDDQIDSMTKQFQAQAATLTDSEKQSRADAITDQKRKEQQLAQDDQSDYQSDMQEMINSVAQKVGAELTAYAKEHGYSVVLDATEQQNQAPIVLYASPATDITKAVIDAYNAKSGIPAPPPPAPAPAAH